jgi:hypothetical protein
MPGLVGLGQGRLIVLMLNGKVSAIDIKYCLAGF